MKVKLEIIMKKVIDKEVDINFPVYFKHKLAYHELEATIYGKITNNAICTIEEAYSHTNKVFNYEFEKKKINNLSNYVDYLMPNQNEHFSENIEHISKDEYERVKHNAHTLLCSF